MRSDFSPTERPRQFALWHLFAFILVISAVLALATQLWYVGVVAAIYVSGIAAGLWRHDWRLAVASATALIIFVVSYLACWLQIGYGDVMDHRLHDGEGVSLRYTELILERYAQENGEFPESLAQAAEFIAKPESAFEDNWGHPLYYQKTTADFDLVALGRDGKLGGTGLDADVYLSRKFQPRVRAKRLPLRQFLFETDGSGAVFLAATMASFLAAAIWYVTLKQDRSRVGRVIFSLLITIVFSVIVAIFLAAFHVAASQSGH